MRSLVVKNITTIGITVSLVCLVGTIFCFKADHLVLGFILCTIGTISFYVGVGGKE